MQVNKINDIDAYTKIGNIPKYITEGILPIIIAVFAYLIG